ncbi:MAG: hypothetical protein ACRDJX_09565 [Solirubrobacteraceae bacterium]
MPVHISIRGLTATLLTCAITLVAALLVPAQTLARTHRASSCPRATAHAKARHGARACEHPSPKGKGHRGKHRSKSKHALAEAPEQGAPASLPAAYCEDGSAPIRRSDGSFACADGSEPECEDGVEPTRSGNGRSLVCAILEGEAEAEGGEAVEPECEEAASSLCSAGPILGSGEQSCEATPGESPSFLCE